MHIFILYSIHRGYKVILIHFLRMHKIKFTNISPQHVHGTVEQSHSVFYDKYRELSTKSLKTALKKLKTSRSDLEEIKYVSQLIRIKIKKETVLKEPDNIS